MSIRLKLVRWSLFLACLTLLGVGIHRFEPDEPRWTAVGNDRPVCFSADGRRVYTLPYKFSGALSAPDQWTPSDADWNDDDDGMWSTKANLRGWDLQTGEPCSTHPAAGQLLMLRRTCSANGRYFASIETQEKNAKEKRRFICLVDLNTGEERRLPLHPDMGKPTFCFSPCGQYLVAGRYGSAPIHVFDCATGQLLSEWDRSYMLWEENSRFWDGHLLYGENDAAGRHHIVLWNLRERKIAAKVADFAEDADVYVRGHLAVVSGDEPGQWRTWNLRTHKLQAEWKTELKVVQSIDLVGIGERCYARISAGDMLETWDIETGMRVETGNVQCMANFSSSSGNFSLMGLFGPSSEEWSKDGKRVMLLSVDKAADPWGFAKGVPVFREFLEWLGVDLSRETGFQFLFVVFDPETGRERLRLTTQNVQTAVLSDDGKSLVTTHGDEMRCWDIGSIKPLRWPLTIPAALGVLLWGSAQGVARWRKRRAVERMQPPAAKTA